MGDINAQQNQAISDILKELDGYGSGTKVKVNSSDTEGYLNTKIIAGSNITIEEDDTGGAYYLTVSSPDQESSSSGEDGYNVKVSDDDTTPEFLEDKLIAGTNITIEKSDQSGREILTFNVPDGGGDGSGSDGYNVKVSNDDTTPEFLEDKLIAGSNITITKSDTGGVEILTFDVPDGGSGGSGSDGYNVKVSSDDTTPGFLEDKLIAGDNITLTKSDTGGNEIYTIATPNIMDYSYIDDTLQENKAFWDDTLSLIMESMDGYGNIIPPNDDTDDLGEESARYRNIYTGAGGLHLSSDRQDYRYGGKIEVLHDFENMGGILNDAITEDGYGNIYIAFSNPISTIKYNINDDVYNVITSLARPLTFANGNIYYYYGAQNIYSYDTSNGNATHVLGGGSKLLKADGVNDAHALDVYHETGYADKGLDSTSDGYIFYMDIHAINLFIPANGMAYRYIGSGEGNYYGVVEGTALEIDVPYPWIFAVNDNYDVLYVAGETGEVALYFMNGATKQVTQLSSPGSSRFKTIKSINNKFYYIWYETGGNYAMDEYDPATSTTTRVCIFPENWYPKDRSAITNIKPDIGYDSESPTPLAMAKDGYGDIIVAFNGDNAVRLVRLSRSGVDYDISIDDSSNDPSEHRLKITIDDEIDAIVIDPLDGYVGIGSTAPLERLTVNGAIAIKELGKPSDIDYDGYGRVYVNAADKMLYFQDSNGYHHALSFFDLLPKADNAYDLGSQELKWHKVWVGPGSLHLNSTAEDKVFSMSISESGDSSGNYQLKEGSTEILTATSAGKIGVGTNTPETEIDVGGKVQTEELRVSTDPTNGKVLVSDTTGNATWGFPDIIIDKESGHTITDKETGMVIYSKDM